MPLTPEEREDVIAAAVERTLLAIPEVIGNLMVNHATLAKINKQFYDRHPELKNHKDVVAAVMERTEGVNTLDSYEDILNKAVPEIKRHLSTLKTLDTKTANKPNFGEL